VRLFRTEEVAVPAANARSSSSFFTLYCPANGCGTCDGTSS
jgi:hypothetical protein